ncbi:MAG: TonB-dependent receptor [Thiobacillus sp.]|nr:TonB-dependent receptor [Thiobacillus sp.]
MNKRLHTIFGTTTRALLLGAAVALPHPAWSAVTEADFLDDLPVVLSVSRLSQPVHDAPAAVTVIDRDMIRASGFRDIPDLLRLVPGFSVAFTRDNTWAAGYHGLGDAYSRRFQVLVDGRSIYSPHYGAVYWTDLPLSIDDIERIEVVRGPNAAIHGANAFAAVINIITKTSAQVPGESVSLQVGEQNARGLTVRHGGGQGDLRYRLTASAREHDRFEKDVNFKTATDNGDYFEAGKTYFVNGRMDWQLSSNSDVMAQFGLAQGNWNAGRRVDNPATLGTYLEPREQDSRAMYLQLAYHKMESPRREWRVQAYYARNRFDADARADLTPLVPAFGVINVDQYLLQTRSNIELQVNEQWTSKLRGVWGGEVRQETVNGPQYYNSNKTWSGMLARAFGNLEWRLNEHLLLQGGAMLEHHYFTGTDISPRAAVNWTLAPGHVIRLGVSRAYRSPTFFEEKGNQVFVQESGALVDVVTVPSDGLTTERVLSREIAYLGHWRPARLEFDLRLFRDSVDDFIGTLKADYVNDGVLRVNEFKYGNIGDVSSHGGEIQLRWRPTDALDVSAHFSRVFMTADTVVENFNEDIPGSAPRNNFGLLARYRLAQGWETSVFVQRSDAQIWLSEGDITERFTRVDLRLARRWKWQGYDLDAALVGQNLGNDYQEFRDTNVFSRRVYGSLSVAW